MPYSSLAVSDIKDHECTLPEPDLLNLKSDRWFCHVCSSWWYWNKDHNLVSWKRKSRSSRKWRKQRLKSIRENLGR